MPPLSPGSIPMYVLIMAVTGARAWWLQSFCPSQPSVRILIERTQRTDDLRDALVEFSDQVETALDQISEAWENEFKPNAEVSHRDRERQPAADQPTKQP